MSKLIRRATLTAFAVLVLSACPSAHTPSPAVAPDQTAQLPQPQSSKPEAVIGLVLGGGASKGFAHIGIIKVLKENDIPVKAITGISADSIVDNLYASDMPPDRLELEAEILGRTDLVDLTLSTSGFIKGEKLQSCISYKVGNRPIQQFPLEFTTVATNLETGKAVAFGRDDAGQAVCASTSIPNMFQPAVIGSHRYVSGGLSQPVPVSAAKTQGVNFVIVVDISARPTKNVNRSFFSYLDQALNIMSISALHSEPGKVDIVIEPKVLELGSVGGFDQENRAIQLGGQAACTALPEIKRRLAAYWYRLTEIELKGRLKGELQAESSVSIGLSKRSTCVERSLQIPYNNLLKL